MHFVHLRDLLMTEHRGIPLQTIAFEIILKYADVWALPCDVIFLDINEKIRPVYAYITADT